MSQSRTRRAPSGSRESTKGVGATVGASGDPKDCQQSQNDCSKSKSNRIPKTIRYDLEKALLGLCDIWFEEIKPHLVRNNIKLHVDNMFEGGDGNASERAGTADGDHQRSTPGCSHLDPAATAPGCELCRLLFNAANSIQSAMSQAATAPPVAGVPLADNNE